MISDWCWYLTTSSDLLASRCCCSTTICRTDHHIQSYEEQRQGSQRVYRLRRFYGEYKPIWFQNCKYSKNFSTVFSWCWCYKYIIMFYYWVTSIRFSLCLPNDRRLSVLWPFPVLDHILLNLHHISTGGWNSSRSFLSSRTVPRITHPLPRRNGRSTTKWSKTPSHINNRRI